MTPDTDRPNPRPVPSFDSEVPASLLAHDTGLTPERLRALLAADDAYTRRRDDDRRNG